MLHRTPRPELLPFVSRVWVADEHAPVGDRELVLPTGAMHVVIRVDHPLRLFDEPDAACARTVGHAIVGGARAAPYVRDVSQSTGSVGAQLRPGVAELLLGVPAIELAGQHTRLDDLWGRPADELRERLALARDLRERLDLFEAALVARLPRVRALHPAVAHALGQFATTDDVAAVVDEVGYSHRQFISVFRHAVGLAPKQYCRVQRLQRAIASLSVQGSASPGRLRDGPLDRLRDGARSPRRSLAEIAVAAGFSDQAHLTREFRELAGVSPGEYRALAPAAGNHVPLKKP
jgi:AraC-like DNA-binding protein